MERDHACDYLEWDSTFFGVRIARVTTPRLNPDSLRAVQAWCQKSHVDCLYFLAGAGDNESVRLAEGTGFRLVDVRVTLEQAVAGAPLVQAEGLDSVVRPVQVVDVPALRAIASRSHRDSRFYNDTRFPRDRCDALYETWIEKSCRGYADTVLVAEVESQPVGYVSCHLRDQHEGQIGLFAIAEKARGRGLARALLRASLDWFTQQRTTKVSVVTQGRNVKAQRLYQMCGFLTCSVDLWYHRWFVPEAGGG